MRILFLDDDQRRKRTFRSNFPSAKIVSTASETIHQLMTDEYNVVFLDHDLGGEVYVDSDREDTGMEVVRWIADNRPNIEKVFIHSCNKDAAAKMHSSLRQAEYDSSLMPFPRIDFDSLSSNLQSR
jgi:ActR/RegA family two-component response regulator